jgi:rubrerythrin
MASAASEASRFIHSGITLGMVVLILTAGAVSRATAGHKHSARATAKSLGNVITVYTNEKNGQAHYATFAEKARAEGYLKVARLFRAEALSEGMYAANHAKTIASLHGQAKAELPEFQTGTTQENLEAALAEEKSETEKQYPAFLQQAEAEGRGNLKSIFTGARAVGAKRVLLYEQALADLPAWKEDGDIYICGICGNVAAKLDFEYCPICEVPVSRYTKVK